MWKSKTGNQNQRQKSWRRPPGLQRIVRRPSYAHLKPNQDLGSAVVITSKLFGMAPSEAYSSIGSGKLKLKGVKDSKVDKKKKKKSSSKSKDADDDAEKANGDEGEKGFQDRSVMLKKLEEEDEALAKEEGRSSRKRKDDQEKEGDEGQQEDESGEMIKTEAERRYDEQRRRRVSYNPCFHLTHYDLGGPCRLTVYSSRKDLSGKVSRHTRSEWRSSTGILAG